MTKDLTGRRWFYINDMYPVALFTSDNYLINLKHKKWRQGIIPFNLQIGYRPIPDSLCILLGMPLAVDKT
jgi:hypothetical protein